MYVFLESVCCAVLVFGAMAVLFAASVMYIMIEQRIPILARVLYRSVHHAGHLLIRSTDQAWRRGGELLKGGILLAVRTSTAAEHPVFIPLGSKPTVDIEHIRREYDAAKKT